MVSQSPFLGASPGSFSSTFSPQLKSQIPFSKANQFSSFSKMGSQFPFLSAISNCNVPSTSVLLPLLTKDDAAKTLEKITKSNESDTSPAKFPLFCNPPPEIRLAIWKEALPEKRSISLNEAFGGGLGPVTNDRSSQFIPPALFHVNQESRSLIHEHYGIVFGMPQKPSYISTQRDEIRIDNETALYSRQLLEWLSKLDKEVPGGVEAIEHFVGRNFHITRPILRIIIDATMDYGGLDGFLLLTGLKKLTITASNFNPFTGEVSKETVQRAKFIFEGYFKLVSRASDGKIKAPVIEILSDAVFRMDALPSVLGHTDPKEKYENDGESGDDTEDDEEDEEDGLELRWLVGDLGEEGEEVDDEEE